MNRRALLVISNLEYGGAQRQVVELANHMKAERYDVHVCSLSDYIPLASSLHDADRRLHVIVKRWKFDITVIPRLAALCKQLGAPLLHSYLFDADIAARLAGRLSGSAAVINSERNTSYHLKKLQLLAYWLTRRCVDLTIANSNAGAVFNSGLLGQDPTRYRVVHNGVDTDRFHPRNRLPIRQELGVPLDTPLVGMFASFKKQKNHPLAFKAMRRVLNRVPEARLLLVGEALYAGMHGSAGYRRDMDRLVDELMIRDRCLFVGNRDDVEKLYSACDVTILPSLFEGTPNVLLESMACGVPVVATDVSDNALIAPDGQVGRIVPLDDEALAEAIIPLLLDHNQRDKTGSNARQWAITQYSCARLAEKTADVYDEVLAARRKAS